MKKNAFSLLESEIAIMKKVDHKHIVRLLEVIEDAEANKLYLIMEYMNRGAILSSHYFAVTAKQESDQHSSQGGS